MEAEALNDGYEQTPTQVIATESVMKVSPIASVVDKTLIIEGGNVGNGQHEGKEENSGPVSSYFNRSDSFLYTQNGPAIGIALSPTDEVREIFLKQILVVPPNHELYCPSCNVCIDKVFYCTTQQEVVNLGRDPKLSVIQPAVPQPFLGRGSAVLGPFAQKPAVPKPSATNSPVIQPVVTEPAPVSPVPEPPVRCSTCFTLLIQEGKQFFSGLVSRVPPDLLPDIVIKDNVIRKPFILTLHIDNEWVENYCNHYHFTNKEQKDIAAEFILHLVGSESDPGHLSIAVPADSSDITPSIESPLLQSGLQPIITTGGSSKGWEILKSIVYGGLAELLASLSVVTSAASADATTLSIVALGIANLIGGLSVLGHNLKDLKSSQAREEGSESDEQVDQYYELLGRRENFFLHAFVAILSFLIFGLVPPIVYGFSFRESNDKDLKLAAVAGASIICITLLGIAKAHIQRPNTYTTYFKTVSFYVASGVLASILTYVAGAFMKRFVEQLGWFEPKSNFGMSLPQMSVEKSWGSY